MHQATLPCLILGLTACSSGGGAPDVVADFTQTETLSRNIETDVNNLGITPTGGLPVSGTANYSGTVTFTDIDYANIGNLAFEVDFATDDINGTASDFLDSQGISYTGVLTVDNGALNRTANPMRNFQFTADMTGTIDSPENSFVVETVLDGDFVGANVEGVTGILWGTVSSDLGLFNVAGRFSARDR